MKKSLLFSSFTFCLFTAAFSQNQSVEAQQNEVEREEVGFFNEGTNDPTSTGAELVLSTDEKKIYLKKTGQLTIEIIEPIKH